jgi:hypothetical protein
MPNPTTTELIEQLHHARRSVERIANAIQKSVTSQYNAIPVTEKLSDTDDMLRAVDAMGWEQEGRSQLRIGFMALERALMQPRTF